MKRIGTSAGSISLGASNITGGQLKELLQKYNNKANFGHRLEIPVNLIDNLIFSNFKMIGIYARMWSVSFCN